MRKIEGRDRVLVSKRVNDLTTSHTDNLRFSAFLSFFFPSNFQLITMATTIEIMDPAFFALMNNPDFKWGNYLVENIPTSVPALASAGAASVAAVAAAVEVVEAPAPEVVTTAVPALVMRKDIWEHFPVHVEYINTDASGCECWSVTWHRKRCATETCDMELLMEALYASPSWIVQDARHSHEICVLQMVNRSRRASPVPAAAPVEDGWTHVASTKAAPKAAYLARVNDIVREFPAVSWNNVMRPGMSARRGDILSIFGNSKMRDQANPTGYTHRLLTALRESTSWRVLRPEGREICRLEIA